MVPDFRIQLRTSCFEGGICVSRPEMVLYMRRSKWRIFEKARRERWQTLAAEISKPVSFPREAQVQHCRAWVGESMDKGGTISDLQCFRVLLCLRPIRRQDHENIYGFQSPGGLAPGHAVTQLLVRGFACFLKILACTFLQLCSPQESNQAASPVK